MQVVVKGSFYRDWKKINNRQLSKALYAKIGEIESAKSSSHISHLKKLRNYSLRYKIEIFSGSKIYWILCVIRHDVIEFSRLKPETYFKKNL